MAKSTTASKRSTQPSTRNLTNGLTVVELLVALAVGLTIIGAAVTVTLSSRDLLRADQTRTGANQNLRSTLDIIGNDVRLAGERLSSRTSPKNIMPVELVGGTELVLRRNVLEAALPVCNSAARPLVTAEVLVALSGSHQLSEEPECNSDGPRDGDGDLMPDDLEAWEAYRRSQAGASVLAYIFNTTGGEFFAFAAAPGSNGTGHFISRSGGGWAHAYSAEEGASIYMLDERRYRLVDGVLELIVNGDADHPLRIVSGVSGFRVRALMADGGPKTDLGAGDDWRQIRSVEVSLTVAGRTLRSEYFPRNILSY